MSKLAKRIRYLKLESTLPKYDPSNLKQFVNAQTINLWGGWSSTHSLPNHIIEAAKKVIGNYPHYTPFGLQELRDAIVEKLKEENGIECDAHLDVLITTGATEAVHLAILSLVESGDEVIMADPEYRHIYEPNVKMAGGKMVYVPVKEEKLFKLSCEDLEKKITSKTKIIVLISPSNPTGSIVDRHVLEGIADIAKEKDLLIISDEVLEKLVYDGKKNYSIGAIPEMEMRTLTINSFSKSWNMAEFRVGYVVGPRKILNWMANIQLSTTFSVSKVAQVAALAALKGPKDWIENIVKQYEKLRNIMVDGLNRIDGVNCQKPEGGTHILLNVKKYNMNTLQFARYVLQNSNLLVMPLMKHQYGEEAEKFVGIGFCKSEEVIKLALEKLKLVIEKLSIQ